MQASLSGFLRQPEYERQARFGQRALVSDRDGPSHPLTTAPEMVTNLCILLTS